MAENVFRAIRLHKTSFKQLRPCRLWRCTGCSKCVRMDFRHETSLHGLHQSRFLRPTEGRLWIPRAIRLLKTSLKRIRSSRFRCPGWWKRVRMAFRNFETSLHRLHNITSLKRFRPSLFIRSSGCRKWFRMAFRHHETSLHRLHESRFLRRSKGRLWIPRAIRLLKKSLKVLHPSRFFRCPGCRKWFRKAFRQLESSVY
jgi:hypothetical protein